MMDALPRIVWHLDDPVADPALVPLYFVAKKAAEHVTVVLSGEGADEFFGGYTIYREPLSLAARQRPARPDAARPAGGVARSIPQGVKGKSFLERGTTPIEERYYGNARIFTEEEKQRLLRRYDPAVRYTDVTAPIYAEAADLDDVTKMQYVDLYTWLRGDILVKADRMSMAHSLELRVPFLDREVFDVAATHPGRPEAAAALRRHEVRAAPGARRASSRRPSSTARSSASRRRPGSGCAARCTSGRATSSPRSGAGDLLDLAYARGLLDAHREGEADHSRKVWTVLVFCIWHAIFVERVARPGHPAQPVGPAHQAGGRLDGVLSRR